MLLCASRFLFLSPKPSQTYEVHVSVITCAVGIFFFFYNSVENSRIAIVLHLESREAVTKAPAVSVIIPRASTLHCFAIKGTLITGSSTGKRAESWEASREKVGQTRLCKTSLRKLKHTGRFLKWNYFSCA